MSSKSSLYSVSRPENPSKGSDKPSSAHSIAFTSTLSSLLASTNKSGTLKPRGRSSKPSKEDIFTTHNKGSKKRALADISDGTTSQKHSTSTEALDAATLHRSKRKMEEKARLYASMKRGDYVPPEGRVNKEAEGLIDFDRKWAEQNEGKEDDTSSDDYDDDFGRSDATEVVEYEDEFGRMRKGTRAEASKLERQRNAAAYAKDELSSFSARPQRPANLIVGDTVQTAAFNPDEPLAAQMETLAKKRDRSMTPPEEVHYDASKEVRSKGVGFYQFSKDSEGRKKEMDALEKEREETERLRMEREKEREEIRAKKSSNIEERRKLIAEKRAQKEKKLADKFLDDLDVGQAPENG